MKMKGTPTSLETIRLIPLRRTSLGIQGVNGNGDDMDVDGLPIHSSCNGYFAVESNTKMSYYAAETELDAKTWVNILHSARQECITHKMGHSKKPISREVEYANMMGKRIVDRKNRIADSIRKRQLDEVEMTCLHGSGTGMGVPSGYFG